jgi:DNA-binding CsgD family transcriptional regulator
VTTDHTPSRSCYQRGCPRPECKQADYQYMSRLRLEHHRGQRRRCDATQTRHHIERLLAAGWTQAQIARAAGLAHRTISGVVAGAVTVSNRTALAILTVPIGPAPNDHRDVDATGTIRRVRALVAIGWPIAHLADRFGMYPTALGNIARGELAQVRATTAETVATTYRELCYLPGPSQRVRNEARKKGWHGPLAWDDIDDPNEQPDTDGVVHLIKRHKAVIDLELVARRTSEGRTAEQIADEIGCHKRSVVRARRRVEMGVAA